MYRWILLLVLLVSPIARAQGCHEPGPFYRTEALQGNIQFVAGGGGDCALSAELAASAAPTAIAVAWYRRPLPATPWRIGFRLDTSALSDLTVVRQALVLAASAHTPYPDTDGVLHVLAVALLGSSGSKLVRLKAACNRSPTHVCVANVPLQSDHELLRFEVSIGAGANGYLRWWQNANFSDPPTGTLENLDNMQWNGVDTVALGIGSSTNGFRSAYANLALGFDAIETPDDFVSWNGFE